MFNQNSVGKRVESLTLGKGTVVEVNLTRHYPVAVKWDLGSEIHDGDTLFTLHGYYIAGRTTPEKDITLLYCKQGTPEARKIVAMLAREWRTIKAHPSIETDDFIGGRMDAFEDAYRQAKQLLLENPND